VEKRKSKGQETSGSTKDKEERGRNPGKKPDMYRQYRWEIIGKDPVQSGILRRES
jgi:hypothetical protein